MTDRELLKLAAKASGIVGIWVDAGVNTATDANPVIWNPLVNCSDAMTLADDLQFTIKFHFGLVLVGNEKKLLADEANEDYKYAIVRAAAEIGKAMK